MSPAPRPRRDAALLAAFGLQPARSRRVGHEEREDREQIARYILRNPFWTAKMHFEPGAGSVLYRSRMNKEAGRQLRGALAHRLHRRGHPTHSRQRLQLVRYYGWYSNKARGVRAKTGPGASRRLCSRP